MFNGNLKTFKFLNPAVLLIHKFSTEYTELVNQQFIFMKTTTVVHGPESENLPP